MPKFKNTVVAILLAALPTVAACSSEPTPPTPPASASSPTPPTTPTPPSDSHGHVAPHGGVLVELGDHFGFLEFVLDAEAGTLTAYVLDGGAEQAVRIAQPAIRLMFEKPASLISQTLAMAGKANVLTGETVGDTSQFELKHEALKGQTVLNARVVELSVKGQTFHGLAVKF